MNSTRIVPVCVKPAPTPQPAAAILRAPPKNRNLNAEYSGNDDKKNKEHQNRTCIRPTGSYSCTYCCHIEKPPLSVRVALTLGTLYPMEMIPLP
jgi:hypothetical protein